ncbi:putative pentatricopeptide repeat-containing protein [Tanacetum coccineum]|uniref:Pentatricopeptide repeat-containing protein n=1 Tax=Tanacetum coccineum TaxID=301880 RepID=A0ABQ5A424_9ASTR
MAVIWNPSVRKYVGIVIPISMSGYVVVGFGVCPDTNGPKLVKVSVDEISSMWVVEVFMLSTRVWKAVYMGAPFKSCYLIWNQVFVNGVIYFHAYDDINLDWGVRSNFIILFDLKSEKFGEVCLPKRLLDAPLLVVANVNELLSSLEYYHADETFVCDVWMRKDGANKTFSKIYTIKVEGKSLLHRVLGFRNNGEVVIELEDDNNHEFRIEVYDPSSGHFNGVGINGKRGTYV